tara:strand:- start:3441 stop:4634 length:1194 start_codon:yes stop_codon:yes gene_type:complete
MSNRTTNNTRPIIGVVGGGQLALMLAQAAKTKEVELIVLADSDNDPAVFESQKIIYSRKDLSVAIESLSLKCDFITFENEWLNIKELNNIDDSNKKFIPSLQSIEPLIDKISQRNFLKKIGFSGPDCIQLNSSQINFNKLPTSWDFPVMAKARSGGYDGKGTRIIRNLNDLKNLYDTVNIDNWFIEEWIPYEREFAITVSRDKRGKVRFFPLVETKQSSQICDWVLAPANVSHSIEQMATNLASSLLCKLDYVGILSIEFFYGLKGLQINEIAPRAHNSAHYSIEACQSSQFDQQLCIAADLDIKHPDLVVPGAVMVNLLGLSNDFDLTLEQRLQRLREYSCGHLHWYNKGVETPGRKLGHITILLKSTDSDSRKVEAQKAVEDVRKIWPLPSTNFV